MADAPVRKGALLTVGVVAVAIAGLLLATPFSEAGPVSPRAGPASGTVSNVLTWNGANVASNGGVSSALSIDLAQQANVRYNWSAAPLTGGPVTVSDARLQMFYFGFAVATRDVTISNPMPSLGGNIVLNWTPIAVSYVLGGAYRLTASLLTPNGTTVWSENFYVKGNAPYGILAVLPILLLLIAVYEAYLLARSGRFATRSVPPSAPTTPPASPESAEEPSGAPPPPPPPPEGAT